MSFKIRCFLLAIMGNVFSFCYAQTTSTVKGNIYLKNNTAADAATAVLIKQADSSMVMSALADTKGAYVFEGVLPGTYLVLATRLGSVKTLSDPFIVRAGAIVIAPVINLQPGSTQLKEVAIVARKPLIEIRPGKVVLSPASSITADGKNALEILAQSPGVRVDHNDNIGINGRQMALVLIDGKATNMTGADLAALLRGIPGSNIDRIELLTGGSAKFDSSAGGVINIVQKKGKNIGTNGTVSLSAGYGNYYKSSAGITFNNRSKYVNLFGNYSFADNKTYKRFSNYRNVEYAGALSSYDLDYYSISKAVTHNYRVGADISLSPNHTIGALIYGFSTANDFWKDNHLNIANNGHVDSTILVNSTVDRNLRSNNYNLNYTGKLGKDGETLTAGLTYSPYKRRSDEYIANQFVNSTGNTYRDALLLQNLSPSDRRNYTAIIDYVTPLSKTAKLEAGIKYSKTKSNNDLVFGPKVGGVYTIDPDFSNTFTYKENVNAAYLNYSNTWGKLDVSLGLRGEYTRSDGYSQGAYSIIGVSNVRSYFNLFPNVLLHFVKNEKNEYTLSFSRGITRPDYESLNPFLYYIDPYNYQSGNPNLRPEYSNVLELGYLYNQNVGITAYANVNTNAIFPYFVQDDASKVNLATSRNLGQVNIYGAKINADLKVTEWWNSVINADGSYQRYRVYPQNGTLDKSTGDLIITTTQTFTITKKLTAEIGGRYETATFYGIRQFRPNYTTNAAIGMQIFAKRGKLSLNVSDLFNTDRDRAYTNFQNLDLRFYDKRETRIVRLNFTYRFGKTTVKGATSHSTGNEDEQSRMRKVTN